MIDHTKKDPLNALTGEGDIDSFMSKYVDQIEDILNTSPSPDNHKTSFLLETIMKHDGLSMEQKLIFTYHYVIVKGLSMGQETICKSCILGPASTILHNLRGSLEED